MCQKKKKKGQAEKRLTSWRRWCAHEDMDKYKMYLKKKKKSFSLAFLCSFFFLFLPPMTDSCSTCYPPKKKKEKKRNTGNKGEEGGGEEKKKTNCRNTHKQTKKASTDEFNAISKGKKCETTTKKGKTCVRKWLGRGGADQIGPEGEKPKVREQ